MEAAFVAVSQIVKESLWRLQTVLFPSSSYSRLLVLLSLSLSLSLLEGVMFSGGSFARVCLLSLCSQQWAFIVAAVSVVTVVVRSCRL